MLQSYVSLLSFIFALSHCCACALDGLRHKSTWLELRKRHVLAYNTCFSTTDKAADYRTSCQNDQFFVTREIFPRYPSKYPQRLQLPRHSGPTSKREALYYGFWIVMHVTKSFYTSSLKHI